jgi:alkylated DNA repair protein alkB homolog 1
VHASSATELMTSLLDPASREYKLARRHHYKTTKNRAESSDSDWTAFRAAEKKYKARFPPPDLSDLLDLALLDVTRFVEIEQTGWKGSADAVQVKAISLKGDEERVRKAYTITDMPGGYHPTTDPTAQISDLGLTSLFKGW